MKLRFSRDGKILAIRAAKRRYGAHRYKSLLGRAIGLHRHTVANCLDKGETCTFDTFDRICENLGLNWEFVSDPESYVYDKISPGSRFGEGHSQTVTLDELVRTVRDCVVERIENDCGTINMFSDTASIDQFVEPHLHRVTRLPSEQLKARYLLVGNLAEEAIATDGETFERRGLLPQYDGITSGGAVLHERQRILIYASPGCGKTSYLKWLAIQCSRGHLLPHCVPIFLEMRHFAPKALQINLQTYIEQYLNDCKVQDISLVTRRLFMEGRMFLLLDGLDEVPEAIRETVNVHITEILKPYYQSYYAFTCRLPLELPFERFQKTIIAPFNAKQRRQYVTGWFSDNDIAKRFLERLTRHINLGELTRTPLLLNLLCRVFRTHKTFPPTRAQVYDWGLNSLLKDEAKRLRQSSALDKLSIVNTRTLLEKIAAEFFLLPQPQILFERREVESKIQEYLEMLFPNTTAMLPASRRIIEDLELTYGLLMQQASNFCSFSHLTFQEYFTAEYLVRTNQYAIVYQHITNSQWRFIIELVAELLRPEQIEDFFQNFKRILDGSISNNDRLRQFIQWVDGVAASVVNSVDSRMVHKQSLLRAWYYAFSLQDLVVSQNLGSMSQRFIFPDFDYAASTLTSKTLELHGLLYQAYHMTAAQPRSSATDISATPDLYQGDLHGQDAGAENVEPVQRFGFTPADAKRDYSRFLRAVDRIYAEVRENPALENRIAAWRETIRIQMQRYSMPQDWWQNERQFWRQRISGFMESLYGLQCRWNFSEDEKIKLRAYYDGTKLLSICMNRANRNLSPSLYTALADAMLRLTSVSVQEVDERDWRG